MIPSHPNPICTGPPPLGASLSSRHRGASHEWACYKALLCVDHIANLLTSSSVVGTHPGYRLVCGKRHVNEASEEAEEVCASHKSSNMISGHGIQQAVAARLESRAEEGHRTAQHSTPYQGSSSAWLEQQRSIKYSRPCLTATLQPMVSGIGVIRSAYKAFCCKILAVAII